MWVTPPLGTRGPALAASTIPPLSVRPCGTRFSNTQEGPNRCRSAPITDPLFRGFGISNRSTGPLVQRAGRDHPFPIFAGSPWRERKGTSHGRARHGFPARGKKYIVVVVSCASVPPPLSGRRALLRAGAWPRRRQRLCRVPNCPSQESIRASLQCSCRSQSPGQPPVCIKIGVSGANPSSR